VTIGSFFCFGRSRTVTPQQGRTPTAAAI